jgi:membrane-bound lytic murein transglycosylase B
MKKQQSTLSLRIEQTDLLVDDTRERITETTQAMQDNQEHLSTLKEQVAENLRVMHQNDERSFLFLLFSNDSLFDVLTQLQQLHDVTSSLGALVDRLRLTHDDLTKQKEALDEQADRIEQLLKLQTLQHDALLSSTREQATLLARTNGKEQNYQAILTDSKEEAAQIRSRLYQLLNVGKQITFGQAVEIAQQASAMTGVRASFLLAILTQESNLGKNVGTCNRPGDPPSKSWKVIMKPTRDQEPFKTITQELGLDPNTTAVSCPMRDKNGNQVGWGGAMGPAQFIPSTWMGYRAKVTKMTGSPANPWDIRDAFIASGIKLAADGASSKEGEWAAAMKYFSGSTNTRFRFYGDNVVATAEKYQKEIEELNGN